MEQKPHIALLPSPGMGHLIPLVELAKLLLLHHDFHITCIIPVLGSPSKAMKAVLQALPTSIDHVFLPPVMLEILENCIVFLNERIYISALYRRHKCAVQVKCSTSTSVLYK